MAALGKVSITEFATPPFSLNGTQMALGQMPPVAVQSTLQSDGASSTQSSAFSNQTNMIRVNTDNSASVVNFYFAFGTSPTATANSTRLAPNQTEYFWVTPGHKLAVISS